MLLMNTDLEGFVDLYSQFGVECKVITTNEGSNAIYFGAPLYGVCFGENEYTEVPGHRDGAVSYTIEFDNSGKFKSHELHVDVWGLA